MPFDRDTSPDAFVRLTEVEKVQKYGFMNIAKIRSVDASSVDASSMDTSSMDTMKLVRSLRGLCGLTQEQFAAKLGVSLVTINRWENDRTKPTPLALRQIKALLEELKQSIADETQMDENGTTVNRLLQQYFPQEL